MPRVGRRRTKHLHLPLGVRPRGKRLYWQPSTETDRVARAQKGLAIEVALGPFVIVRGRIEMTLEQRKTWAALTGRSEHRDAAGTVGELLTLYDTSGAIEKRPNGRPLAKGTVKAYRWQLPAIRERLGAARYGKTEFEASRGEAIGTAQIQRFINDSGSYASQRLAVLSNAFNHAIREGLTTYNPCDKVISPAQDPRTRAPLEWEVEAFGAMAPPVVDLVLAFKNIHGWRISKIIGLQRKNLHADGIRPVPDKGGKPEVWNYSPESRRILAAAESLPRATKFPASPIFPSSTGRAYSYSGIYAAWRTLAEETNAALAEGVIDLSVAGGQLWPGLQIEDLHMHDVRSKAHDDAEDMGREGHELLGNSEHVADEHYARREKRRTPLR
jgi:site-specific recombinase XerD